MMVRRLGNARMKGVSSRAATTIMIHIGTDATVLSCPLLTNPGFIHAAGDVRGVIPEAVLIFSVR